MILAIFGFGPFELLVIGGIVLVVAGPAVLPRVGKYLGQMMVGLRKSANELSSQLSDQPKLPDNDEGESEKKEG